MSVNFLKKYEREINPSSARVYVIKCGILYPSLFHIKMILTSESPTTGFGQSRVIGVSFKKKKI